MDDKITKVKERVTALKDNVVSDTHRGIYEQGINRGMEIAYEAVIDIIDNILNDPE